MSISFAKINKNRSKKMIQIYTLFFAIVAVFLYGTFIATGHTLIWSADATAQHLPLLESFREAVINFLHHPFSPNQWSWKFGLGADTLSIFSYYNIGDVFSYLILLFPKGLVPLGYQLILILRLYCAGLAFIYFMAHIQVRGKYISTFAAAAGSLVYLFNTYLEYAHLAQPLFTTAFILFPLIILEIERTLQTGTYWRLSLVFSWMLISNFYFAYMLGLGGIAFLALQYFMKYRGQRKFVETVVNFVKPALISLFSSAFILIPELIDVANSTRSVASFANGLKFYPLFYYIMLPTHFITGDSNSLLFWTALGFGSIVFFAVIYTMSRFQQFRLLNWSMIISLVIIMLPAFGAILNGFTTPSNRWTFILCFIAAVASSIFLDNVALLDNRTLKLFSYGTGIYAVVIIGTYLFHNSSEIFLPMIFLLGQLFLIYLVNYNHIAGGRKLIAYSVLANIAVNCFAFAAPFNNDFASSFLPQHTFAALQKNFFHHLNNHLTSSKYYRVSTISNNYQLGGIFSGNNNDLVLANPILTNLKSINSYYSLQNKYVGNFMNDMQNRQYIANIPVAQADDRTGLENFLGVKYIFQQLNNPNDGKIPYGYKKDKQTKLVRDLNGNNKLDSQTTRLKTRNDFPLIYWQRNAISPQTYSQLSPSGKEMQLSSGVVMPTAASCQGLAKAKIIRPYKVPYQLYSSHLKNPKSKTDSDLVQVASGTIKKMDPNETYQLVLPKNSKFKNSELQIELDDISFQPFTKDQLVKYSNYYAKRSAAGTVTPFNSKLNAINVRHKYITTMQSDKYFAISATAGSNINETIQQLAASSTSFYLPLTKATLNMGYHANMPEKVGLAMSRMGTYHFKLKVYAIPYGSSYNKRVAKIKRDGLQDVRFYNNDVTGTFNHSKTGVLTSSIPYSIGWQAYIDGKKAQIIRTNSAFVGLKVPAGRHKVSFVYQTPGLKLGILISFTTLVIVLGGWYLLRRRNLTFKH